MSTVKSMQMEPTLERRYGDYLASYLKAGFGARQLVQHRQRHRQLRSSRP